MAVQKDRIGVIGAGTMGSGIALTALLANLKVVLYDLDENVLSKARDYIEKHLNRKQRAINIKYLEITNSLEKMKDCGIVVEAAPEILQLKQDIFRQLSTICPAPAILATNTSTLPVTAIAAAAQNQDRVGGMHFFNPAPVMPLIEIIRAPQTSNETIAVLEDLARSMGKTPVVARDTPGFIVNRVARPFYGEALRIFGEGAARPDQIDDIVRQAGGFRMGPFELMDLIGIDINFAATQSVYEQTFGEPRYRPHLIQAQMVQQKALGRKTGRGFYQYDEQGKRMENSVPAIDFTPVYPLAHEGVVLFGTWAPGLKEAFQQAGIAVEDRLFAGKPPTAVFAAWGKNEHLKEQLIELEASLPDTVPVLCQCADITLGEASAWLKHPERLAGFDGIFLAGGVMTLAAGSSLRKEVRSAINSLVAHLGKTAVWIEDIPGLVLPRIVSMLANEAAFAVGEKVAEPDTIDQAMQLGTNYPKGPLRWADEIGYDRIIAVLDHLREEYGEERYRVAPLLKHWQRKKPPS
jgi:3-hydroxybutyryl-CoA dehydrogenase